jgi:hypothetical protein
VHGAEQEIARRAVPGAHLEIHHAHADGRRFRAAEGEAVVEDRPDGRAHGQQPEQQPAEAEREDPEQQDEQCRKDHRHRDDDDVDHEGEHAP